MPRMRRAVEHLGEGTVVAGFDSDLAGDKLREQLEAIVKEVSSNSLIFKDNRPVKRNQDWNNVLKQQRGLKRSVSLKFGR